MIKQTKNMILLTTAIFMAVIMAPGNSQAVPTLQLYIEGAEYNFDTESWMSYDNPFNLQVIGATSPANISTVTDLKLHIAVPEEWYLGSGGKVSITGPGHEGTTDLFFTDDTPFGSPDSINGDPDRFPAYYQSINLPDMDFANSSLDNVTNWDPTEADPGTDTGIIFEYTMAYDKDNLFGVHLNLTGLKDGQKQIFAPFSHNADAPGVPEPATLLLFGTGLIGLAGWGRKRLFGKSVNQ